jgi:hypothetical protein
MSFILSDTDIAAQYFSLAKAQWYFSQRRNGISRKGAMT